MGWLVPVALITIVAGLIGWRVLVGRREPGYLALTEYWVYTTEKKLPDQTKLMDRMISSNPHNKPGRPSIGAREGMLFTDVRLHLAVALKEKNALVFRPDLFEEDVEPTAEILERLANCDALVKVRYASEAVLKDNRHLQFLPHMTEAISEMMNGQVVFDHIGEKMWTAEDFRSMLQQTNNTERPEFHVRVQWKQDEDSCYARTYGLRKVGLAELKSDPQESDREVLITGLMMRLAFQLVRKPDEQGPFEFDEFGDLFILELGELEDGIRKVAIRRRQVVG
ncbi:MAG: hypothetical protein KF836_08905 [Fimbriimonadaceae bacterium]|nr:hypothetical protein [Fimbriimonadaceae bacterium]